MRHTSSTLALSAALVLSSGVALALAISGFFATESAAVATRSILSTTDTKIAENSPDRNYGNVTTLGADGDVGNGRDTFALIKWDVSSIAPGTKVSSASITLSVTDSSSQTYEAYNLKRAWVESAATWKVYASGKPWEVAGAKGTLDRDAAVVGGIRPSVKGNQTFSLSPAVVQGWVDNPTSNQGIIIADTANTDGFDFTSGESSTTSERPKLTINLDDTAPDTTIDSGPSGIVNSSSASFAFSSSETGSSFACKLDDAVFSTCTTPTQYANLDDGAHTFQVVATDAAGNTDPTPASRTWTIDAAAPRVVAVTPAEGATGVVTTANAEATFSEAMNPNTLTTSTFTLAKQGTTTPIEAVVTYEATTKKATLDPNADLEANATYSATVRGGTDGAKDAVGNPLAVDKVWFFTTGSAPPADTTPPETTIDSGPTGTVNTGTASFAFSSSEANSTYECSLDGTPFSGCTSPKEYNNLADGTHTFEVRATDAVGNTDATPATRTWTVQTVPTQNEQVLVGAGDIATSTYQDDEATAKLLDAIPGTVFTVGDNVYESGTADEFSSIYHPTWGRHKARTKPAVGDHEYLTLNASGYFGYFGAAAGDPSKGYYSYDLGDWHAVVLNSNCTKIGGCGSTSPMVTWLKNDLAANPTKCTVAYFHHPLFSSGRHGNISAVKPIWDALYAANVDVVMNGNDHFYERFAPQDPNGVADTARGIREFVVGTGGRQLYSLGTIKPNSEVRNNSTFGVLKLTLKSESYEWNFVPKASQIFTDSGSGSCH